MAVLILGGAGYIGSHMVDQLITQGKEKVIVVDNLVTGHRQAVHSDAIFYEGDLSDKTFMRQVFRENPDVDAVIHFAAFSLVAESMENPLKYFDNNTAGMIKLLEVMNECDIKNIVFSSTAATYGIPEQVPILETAPQNPINPYGESKLMMETIMKWADQATVLSLSLYVTSTLLEINRMAQLGKIINQKHICYQSFFKLLKEYVTK